VARSETDLEKVFAELSDVSSECLFVPFDLRNVDALPGLVDRVHELAGPIHVLINNAGVERWAAFQEYAETDLREVITTNLLAPMELTRLVLPEMLARGSGHVVNIASLSGKRGDPYNSLYSASKAGLIAWTDALRQEIAGTGVGVSLVSPGPVAAGMFLAHSEQIPAFVRMCPPRDVSEAVIKAIEAGRAEILVNAGLAPVLYAIAQFSPLLADAIYRWIGVPEMNAKTARDMAGARAPTHT